MAPKKTAKPEKDTQATNLQAEKLKALEHALADLDKQFGKGAVMKMGADAIVNDIPVIPTGCLTLDAALGVGGIPRSRCTWWPRPRRPAASPRSWTRSTRWIPCMPGNWA